MENKKNQFFGFVIILLILGFLNYFRKVGSGVKMTRNSKLVHIGTMITSVVGIMFVLYYTNLNNVLSFLVGLAVAHLSEHIANFFMLIGDHFNLLMVKIIKKVTGVDMSELIKTEDEDKEKSENEEKNK